MKIKECPLCQNEKIKSSFVTKDFSLSQEDFTICECANCGFLFTNPRPDNSEIGEYYKSSNYISHTNQSNGFFGKAYQIFRKRALGLKQKWIEEFVEEGRLLDYGSGTGEFLNHMQQHGWKVKGIEIAEVPRRQAQEKYNLDVKSPAELDSEKSNSYDVITMWHVLEHVDDLLVATQKIVSKITPGGYLILALPNPESWDAKHYEKYWAAWDVPIHLYHFKKKDIALLAKKLGLELVKTINMPYDAYYVSLLSEEYKTGSKNWIRALYAGIKSNFLAGKNNASSLTYVLRKL